MAKVPRSVIKEYFQTGDKPTQPQFNIMLDSMVNFVDDREFIGLRDYNVEKNYLPGDCAVFNNEIVKCIAATTGPFNPANWVVLAAFGSVSYVGTWDTQNNVPALASSVGTKGFYYVVINASPDPNDNTELNGIDDWGIGDWAIYNGTAWEKVDNSTAPVEAQNVSFNPSGNLSATNVQAAIEELDAEKQQKLDLKPTFIPFAVQPDKLGDSWLENANDGVALSRSKVFRSEKPGEGQIEFGSTNDQVRLSTAGSTNTESRMFLTPKATELYAENILLNTNDGSSLKMVDGGTVTLVNNAGAGVDCSLTLEPSKATLEHVDYGMVHIGPGSDNNGRAVLKGANNTLVITKQSVKLSNKYGNEATIELDNSSKIEITSDDLQINSAVINIPALTASTVVVADATMNLVSSTVTSAELNALSGVTSSVQSQLNAKVDISGSTMTGDLILNSDPTQPLGAATKQYTDAGLNLKVDIAGSTMTGDLILNADPVASLGAATKQYVDNSEAALQSQVNTKVNRSGDTMTGDLILNADPTQTLGAVTKQYADAGLNLKVDLTGSTMSGALVLNADPSTPLGAATKQYVDNSDASLQSQVNAKVNRAGDTMTGNLILNADPVTSLGAVTKQYADAGLSLKVDLTGSTMTGDLILNANPSAALGAATKQYVDNGDTQLQSQVNAKVNRSGDTMTGNLVLNADPVAALGAVTKQYADAIQAALNSSKVNKSGDTMTGQLVLSGDPSVALGAATKQYVDAATKKLVLPFTFNNDFATNSATFTSIPLQVIIPDPAVVFPGASTVTAKLTIDFMTENGATPAQGEAGLTEWTTATSGSPSLIANSLIPLPATTGVWTKATNSAAFSVAGNRSYRVIFRKTAGSGSAQPRIESATLTLFFS